MDLFTQLTAAKDAIEAELAGLEPRRKVLTLSLDDLNAMMNRLRRAGPATAAAEPASRRPGRATAFRGNPPPAETAIMVYEILRERGPLTTVQIAGALRKRGVEFGGTRGGLDYISNTMNNATRGKLGNAVKFERVVVREGKVVRAVYDVPRTAQPPLPPFEPPPVVRVNEVNGAGPDLEQQINKVLGVHA